MGFASDIVDWTTKTRISGGRVMRKIGLDGFRGIALRSPTKTGRFRLSHRVSQNQVDTSVEPPIEGEFVGSLNYGSVTAAEFQRASSALRGVTWNDTIHITNNLPYARKLENGASAQNGNQVDGIYGATFAELQANIAKTIVAARTGAE